MYHLAKHVMKHVSIENEYEISFIPMVSTDNVNMLNLTMNGDISNTTDKERLQKLSLMFSPHINFIKMIKVNINK